MNESSYENPLKGVARNTSDDFRGHAELCLSRKTIKVVQKSTRNILSEHPIELISFCQPIKAPQYFCFVAKKQIHGSIGDERACFFFKHDNQEDMTVLTGNFQKYFGKAAVSDESASIQSSGSSGVSSASSSTLDRRFGVITPRGTFGNPILGRDPGSSLGGIDIGGSVRPDDALHNTNYTGVYSETDSGQSQQALYISYLLNYNKRAKIKISTEIRMNCYTFT